MEEVGFIDGFMAVDNTFYIMNELEHNGEKKRK